MAIINGLKYKWKEDFDHMLAYFQELSLSKTSCMKSQSDYVEKQLIDTSQKVGK